MPTHNNNKGTKWTRNDSCVAGGCNCSHIRKVCRICDTKKSLCHFGYKGNQIGTAGNPRRQSHCLDCREAYYEAKKADRVSSWLDDREGEIAGFVFTDGVDWPIGEIVNGADGVPAVRPFVRLSRKQKGRK